MVECWRRNIPPAMQLSMSSGLAAATSPRTSVSHRQPSTDAATTIWDPVADSRLVPCPDRLAYRGRHVSPTGGDYFGDEKRVTSRHLVQRPWVDGGPDRQLLDCADERGGRDIDTIDATGMSPSATDSG